MKNEKLTKPAKTKESKGPRYINDIICGSKVKKSSTDKHGKGKHDILIIFFHFRDKRNEIDFFTNEKYFFFSECNNTDKEVIIKIGRF